MFDKVKFKNDANTFLTNMFDFIKKILGFDNKTPTNEDTTMKYLIAGLGNMGADYDGTRHNIGFEIVDALAYKFEVKFESNTHGNLAQFKHKGKTFILLKPTTYMNLSGKAVRYWLQKEKIPQENLLVILDDLNLDFGKQRLRSKGSDSGHNGLKSIDEMLGNQNYARLRFGIGSNFPKGRQADYVLGKWNKEEGAKLPEFLPTSIDIVLAFATIGIEMTMTQFNKK
jgi:peptidyl-tRNA hydrolase, PTH1 family